MITLIKCLVSLLGTPNSPSHANHPSLNKLQTIALILMCIRVNPQQKQTNIKALFESLEGRGMKSFGGSKYIEKWKKIIFHIFRKNNSYKPSKIRRNPPLNNF